MGTKKKENDEQFVGQIDLLSAIRNSGNRFIGAHHDLKFRLNEIAEPLARSVRLVEETGLLFWRNNNTDLKKIKSSKSDNKIKEMIPSPLGLLNIRVTGHLKMKTTLETNKQSKQKQKQTLLAVDLNLKVV